jgi:peptidyl-tRNA hydrolase
VRVVAPGPGEWAAFERAARVAVHDGGFTEVPPGTRTALGGWSF